MHFFRLPLVLLATTFITAALADPTGVTGTAESVLLDLDAMGAAVDTLNSIIVDLPNTPQTVSAAQTFFDAFTAAVTDVVQTGEDIDTLGPFNQSNSGILMTNHVIPAYASINSTLNSFTQQINALDGFLDIPKFGSDVQLLLGQFENATQAMVFAIEDKFASNAVAQQTNIAQSILSNFGTTFAFISFFLASNNNSLLEGFEA